MQCAAKNSGSPRARGGLLGDRLGAVLAELGGVPVADLRVGPGAAHAVEAVGLVQLEQGLGGALAPIWPSARFIDTATAVTPAA